MLARICTENKNYQDIVELVGKYFDGATIIKADGLWQGKVEHSLVIEIVIQSPIEGKAVIAAYDMRDLGKLVHKIKKLNKQDAVLVQYIECESRLV